MTRHGAAIAAENIQGALWVHISGGMGPHTETDTPSMFQIRQKGGGSVLKGPEMKAPMNHRSPFQLGTVMVSPLSTACSKEDWGLKYINLPFSALSESLLHICSWQILLTPWHWLSTVHQAREPLTSSENRARRVQECHGNGACSRRSPATQQINFPFQLEVQMISDIQVTAH